MRALAAIAIALGAMPLIAHAQEAAEEEEPTRVLYVLAHPDDEIFMAPAIARAIRDGEPHTIVYATSGDAGPGVSDMERGAELAEVREGEARCSIEALGGGDIRFLRLGDGKLAENAHYPDSAARKLSAAIDAVLAEQDFGIVVTWGPDGGYGHPDHRMVSNLVTQSVQAMGEDRPTLLYPGIEDGTLPPVPEMQGWAVSAKELLPISYAYNADDLARVRSAADCHKTQFDGPTRAAIADLFDQSIWRGSTHFRRAFDDMEPVLYPNRD